MVWCLCCLMLTINTPFSHSTNYRFCFSLACAIRTSASNLVSNDLKKKPSVFHSKVSVSFFHKCHAIMQNFFSFRFF